MNVHYHIPKVTVTMGPSYTHPASGAEPSYPSRSPSPEPRSPVMRMYGDDMYYTGGQRYSTYAELRERSDRTVDAICKPIERLFGWLFGG